MSRNKEKNKKGLMEILKVQDFLRKSLKDKTINLEDFKKVYENREEAPDRKLEDKLMKKIIKHGKDNGFSFDFHNVDIGEEDCEGFNIEDVHYIFRLYWNSNNTFELEKIFSIYRYDEDDDKDTNLCGEEYEITTKKLKNILKKEYDVVC